MAAAFGGVEEVECTADVRLSKEPHYMLTYLLGWSRRQARLASIKPITLASASGDMSV